MKAYKCILPFVVLFLVHGASATFGLWNSEKIKDLVKHKINRLYIPFITPRYPLFNHDYPIFRYYFSKPAPAKNIFINNPINVHYGTDGVVYGSGAANIQTIDLPYDNKFGQHGSAYEFHINNDNVQAGDQSNGGITEEHENEYIYPTINNDNLQVDGVSNDGIVEDYESDYAYPDDSNYNVRADGQYDDEIAEEYEDYNPQTDNESNIKVITGNNAEHEGVVGNTDSVENVGEKVTDSNTDTDYDTGVVDADEGIIIVEDNISEADTEPIIEDVDESGFAYAEPASRTVVINGNEGDYLNAQSDLVHDGTIDKHIKLNNSQRDIQSDTGSAKGYDDSAINSETTTGKAFSNSIKSNTGYFPLIDIRIGG